MNHILSFDGTESLIRRAPFAERIRCAQNLSERFAAIDGYYRAAWPAVKLAPCHRWAIDPYEVDWCALFSPIEDAVWFEIRAEGIVLYPQHPIAGFFVDFGHPVARVAVECDGRKFHSDRAKDDERQHAIESRGWKVYRLTSSECRWQRPQDEDPETGAPVFVPSFARKVLREIAATHGLSAFHRGAEAT